MLDHMLDHMLDYIIIGLVTMALQIVKYVLDYENFKDR